MSSSSAPPAAPTPALYSTPDAAAAPAPASSSTSLRPDLVSSAISFLSDPKVQASSLSQRVSFLEAKGLSPLEIDEAMRQVGGGSSSSGAGQLQAYSGPSSQVPAPYYGAPPANYPQRPMYPYQAANAAAAQKQGLDWRDWFIMTVVTGTVGYGIISLAKRYLFPHLQPPNATALEADLERLNAKYDEVAATLASIDEETQAIRAGVDEQRADVERSVEAIDKALEQLQEGEKRREDDMKAVKREVDRMKEELPNLFAKTKEAQSASLQDLQSELKSLKALLVSRGTAAPPQQQQQQPSSSTTPSINNTPSTPTAPTATNPAPASPSLAGPPFFSARPSIPAWQLAGGSGSLSSPVNTASRSLSSSTTVPTSTTTATTANTNTNTADAATSGSASGSGSGSGSSKSNSTVTSGDADTLTKSSTSESSE
ncbi:unnamed protein product [Tilletia laevis]|uniref:Peroxisomal membrane protein PEX14 n=3 Tax=Tilletia TaxID=13289 RepID=A0A8X7MM43_9BASI|nr:hypothetical protein CF336_g7224 [Tilletia laevis]KAE8187310.1 hypothetical protein CF328_g6958 [Tilletia controversa]KAE8247934.1 hypothetical protein A4X03_0g6920 [Tilletia caries]KAE8188402.1 hypothetical protein CF335_g6906 [Tilletia laevis]KAE8240994.1 hypothetical protein A4X06_0g7699 [Tilletia controversa]